MHSFFALYCVNKCTDRFLQWFHKEYESHTTLLQQLTSKLESFTSDNPLAFWEKSKITIKLPMVPHATPTKASHSGMSLADFAEAQEEIPTLLKQGLIRPS